MTVTYEWQTQDPYSRGSVRYIGASTDVKPTQASYDNRLPKPTAGSTFREYDTGHTFITYDGTNWVIFPQEVCGVLSQASTTKSLSGTGYNANNVLSESASTGTAWRFANIARANGAGGYITKAQVLCSATGLANRLTLFLFRVNPGSYVNNDLSLNTAPAYNDANYIGRMDMIASLGAGGASEWLATPSTVGSLPQAFITSSTGSDIYAIAVTLDAVTISLGSSITIRLTAEQY